MKTAPAACAALVLTLLLGASSEGAATAPPPEHAPGFTLPALEGTVCLDSLRGHVVLVDFWASWCQPCRKSFPWLNAMQDRYRKQGLTVIGVNLDKQRKPAETFLDELPAHFPVAFDPDGKVAEEFKVKAMPSSVLIGPDGAVLYRHAGFDPGKTGEMETWLAKECGS